MLGEQIGEDKGKITARKVLCVDNDPTMEVSFDTRGKLLGLEMQNIGTYWSRLRQDGHFYGEGQGIIMGKNGESATWKGQGVGRMTEQGGHSFRGALYFQSTGNTFKRLNSHAVVYEHEVDAEGNISNTLAEWR